jgi:hypothetical protein
VIAGLALARSCLDIFALGKSVRRLFLLSSEETFGSARSDLPCLRESSLSYNAVELMLEKESHESDDVPLEALRDTNDQEIEDMLLCLAVRQPEKISDNELSSDHALAASDKFWDTEGKARVEPLFIGNADECRDIIGIRLTSE